MKFFRNMVGARRWWEYTCEVWYVWIPVDGPARGPDVVCRRRRVIHSRWFWLARLRADLWAKNVYRFYNDGIDSVASCVVFVEDCQDWHGGNSVMRLGDLSKDVRSQISTGFLQRSYRGVNGAERSGLFERSWQAERSAENGDGAPGR